MSTVWVVFQEQRDRFAHFIDADSLQRLNAHLLSELAEDPAVKFNLEKSISFNEVFFDSTCLKSRLTIKLIGFC